MKIDGREVKDMSVRTLIQMLCLGYGHELKRSIDGNGNEVFRFEFYSGDTFTINMGSE